MPCHAHALQPSMDAMDNTYIGSFPSSPSWSPYSPLSLSLSLMAHDTHANRSVSTSRFLQLYSLCMQECQLARFLLFQPSSHGRKHGGASRRDSGSGASASSADASSPAAAAVAAADRPRRPAALAAFPRFLPQPRRLWIVVSPLHAVMDRLTHQWSVQSPRGGSEQASRAHLCGRFRPGSNDLLGVPCVPQCASDTDAASCLEIAPALSVCCQFPFHVFISQRLQLEENLMCIWISRPAGIR